MLALLTMGGALRRGGILPVQRNIESRPKNRHDVRSSSIPTTPIAQAALSWLSMCDGNPRGALERAEQAHLCRPQLMPLHGTPKGRILLFSGRPNEGRVASLDGATA